MNVDDAKITDEQLRRDTRAFKRTHAVHGYPTILLLETAKKEEIHEVVVTSKKYYGSRDLKSLVNFMRRAVAQDVRRFEGGGKRAAEEAKDYAAATATESNAAFFLAARGSGDATSARKTFEEEARKEENLHAWFGTNVEEDFEGTKQFLDGLGASEVYRNFSTEMNGREYVVVLAVHPRVLEGDKNTSFTTEFMLCRNGKNRMKDKDFFTGIRKGHLRDEEDYCDVSKFVRTRIVAPLASLDQSVFNNVREADTPAVFLVESGGQEKINAFAKNALNLAFEYRDRLAFLRVDGDELGSWIEKEMAFGPITSSYPLPIGYHKKKHQSWYYRRWRSCGRTVEDALRFFVEMNFDENNPKRLPNFLPSMPVAGKVRNLYARLTFRFTNTNDSVQHLATFWWLCILAMIGLLLGLNFALSSKPSFRGREKERVRSKKMQ